MTTDPDLQYLTDVFSGADGGIAFIKLRTCIDIFKERAAEGDKDAAEIIEVMRRFCRLTRKAQEMT